VAGTLLKRGAGTLGLSGEACAIKGRVSIQEGTVSLTNGAARTAALDVKNGASLLLDAGTTLGHGGLNMTGPISGTGSLTTRNTGHLLLYSDMSGYSGTLIADNSCLALMSAKSAHAGVDIQLSGPQGRIPYLAIGPVFVGSVAEIGSLSGRGDIGVQYDADAGVRTLKINQSVDGLWNGRVTEDANGTRTLALIKDGAATFGIVGDVVQAYALQIAAGDVDIGAGTANGTHYGPIALSAPDTRILWRRSDVTTVTHAAAIIGSGSVLIDGAATIVLAGANTYSGGTTVSNGTLLVNGSHTGGTGYTVESGATFGGTGTVTLASGTVNLLAGTTLAAGPASGAGGTFTVSSLTLAPDAGVTFDAIDDAIVVTGTLALNDNRVTPTHIGSLDKNKRYPILTCQGTVNGSLASRIADTSWIVIRDGNTFFLQYNAGTVISFR
jgi:autotransporter-associated beta strand protein